MMHRDDRPQITQGGNRAKRASITETAEAVFAREGFAAATIDMIAAEAGVSRQTIYNHYGDKHNLFVAVVNDITTRSTAGLHATMANFPDRPSDLSAELVQFAKRLIQNCMCNHEGQCLRRIVDAEGGRYPEIFAAWREHGPGRSWHLIAARLARLAHAGLLEIDDPDVAARQFIALAYADIEMIEILGGKPSETEIDNAARNAVRTFLRAYARTTDAAGQPAEANASTGVP